MAKVKTTFYCQNCGAQSAQWMGKCKACEEWNTLVEEVVSKDKTEKSWKVASTQRANQPLGIQEISLGNEVRIDTDDQELNRVLGGGIVPGSLVLLAGDPGIGKSTLLLQVSLGMQRNGCMYRRRKR